MTPPATRRGPVAVLLRCPNCGHDLPGLDADRAWACAPCGRAWEVEGERLAERPYRAWRAPAEGAPLWLPFWRVAWDATVEGDDAAARAALERAASRGRAWVRAFRLDSAFLVGDPGQSLTARADDPPLDASDLPVLVGARFASAEAVRLAELFVLAEADREEDVTPVRLTLVPREIALVAVPFSDAGDEIVCAADGRRFRKRALPDLDGIAGSAAR